MPAETATLTPGATTLVLIPAALRAEATPAPETTSFEVKLLLPPPLLVEVKELELELELELENWAEARDAALRPAKASERVFMMTRKTSVRSESGWSGCCGSSTVDVKGHLYFNHLDTASCYSVFLAGQRPHGLS